MVISYIQCNQVPPGCLGKLQGWKSITSIWFWFPNTSRCVTMFDFHVIFVSHYVTTCYFLRSNLASNFMSTLITSQHPVGSALRTDSQILQNDYKQLWCWTLDFLITNFNVFRQNPDAFKNWPLTNWSTFTAFFFTFSNFIIQPETWVSSWGTLDNKLITIDQILNVFLQYNVISDDEKHLVQMLPIHLYFP